MAGTVDAGVLVMHYIRSVYSGKDCAEEDILAVAEIRSEIWTDMQERHTECTGLRTSKEEAFHGWNTSARDLTRNEVSGLQDEEEMGQQMIGIGLNLEEAAEETGQQLGIRASLGEAVKELKQRKRDKSDNLRTHAKTKTARTHEVAETTWWRRGKIPVRSQHKPVKEITQELNDEERISAVSRSTGCVDIISRIKEIRIGSSTVSSPTGRVENISRITGICTGRESPGGASGSLLRWSTSRGERQKSANQPEAMQSCGRGEEGQDKDKEARQSAGPDLNTDAFAGKGD